MKSLLRMHSKFNDPESLMFINNCNVILRAVHYQFVMPTTVSLLLRLPNNLRHWILGQLILLIGGASVLGYTSGVNNTGDLKTLHADMGLIAWGALLPFGAIIPRYFKHHDPQWFDRHISIQIVGFLLGLATVVAGRALYNGLESDGIPKFNIHRPLGSLVFCLSILQVLELILRPDKTSKWRKDWKHHWVGRLAVFLGGLKIVIGLLVAEAGSGWKIGYGILITFILVTVTVLDVSLGLGRSNKADATPVFGCN